MKWSDFWSRVGGRRSPASVGQYRDLESFAGRKDLFTATRVFPAEPDTLYHYLVRRVPDRDAEDAARLVWSARLLHELSCPYIPGLADLGIHESFWYVAFRIDAPLRLLAEARYDPLTVVRQVAEALAHMHERSLAHRALCPSGIAIGGTGAAVLFDLSWIGSFGDDRRVRSVLGRRSRTAYDAPECGEPEFDGVRADIYSLGVLARELLPAHVHGGLVREMTQIAPADRPSLGIVFQGLAGAGGAA